MLQVVLMVVIRLRMVWMFVTIVGRGRPKPRHLVCVPQTRVERLLVGGGQ